MESKRMTVTSGYFHKQIYDNWNCYYEQHNILNTITIHREPRGAHLSTYHTCKIKTIVLQSPSLCWGL